MKSTFFKKVYGETVVEVNLPQKRMIDNLRQLNGLCRSTDTDGCELVFKCSKGGRIRMLSSSISKICIRGSVDVHNGKTVVRFYEVYDHSNALLRWGLLALNVLWLGFHFVFDLDFFWLLLIDLVLCVGAVAGVGLSEKRNAPLDFSVMKDEMMRKIEAAEKWNE